MKDKRENKRGSSIKKKGNRKKKKGSLNLKMKDKLT